MCVMVQFDFDLPEKSVIELILKGENYCLPVSLTSPKCTGSNPFGRLVLKTKVDILRFQGLIHAASEVSLV